ncbi:hypothetical protein ACT3TS_07250 [Specibacter sp. AOP5-B1-6]|uniref:hypothetical protein n=1 Tax=Specibacter sp. AOP5-B1-6 TaxID=3457653 RepID=UPI00402B319C
MDGRNWLVRRAEKRVGPKLGNLVYIASTRRIRWSWLLPCLAIGFIYGVIGEFIGSPRSTRTPDRFENIPMFIVVSALTGLVLWAITFAFAFRKLLVFDGGIVTSYVQKAGTRVFPWHTVNPASIRAVTTQDGSSPTSRLAAKELTKLGLRGRFAVVFQGSHEPNGLTTGDSTPPVAFWAFESADDPATLIHAIQHAMRNARVPGAGQISGQALPPFVLTTKTALD